MMAMMSMLSAQAAVEYGSAIAGVSTRFSSLVDRVEANYQENQTTWFIVGAIVLVMLVWRRR